MLVHIRLVNISKGMWASHLSSEEKEKKKADFVHIFIRYFYFLV